MIAVIVGATGLVGNLLLNKLILSDKISKVISFSRRPTGIQNSKLQEIIVSNLSEIKNKSSELAGDLYFCCLGTTIKAAGNPGNFKFVDHDSVVEFGKIAKSHNAKCFSVISASGANPSSRIFYNQVKGQTETDLKNLGLSKLIIFRPALLVGDRKEFRLAESLFIKLFLKIKSGLPPHLSKRIMTSTNLLADQMLELSVAPGAGTTIVEAKNIG